MSKIIVREMKLRRWFPPNDRLAASVARLCILREDFALEMWGLYAGSMKRLDDHSPFWRKMYFWRNLVRTLWEIRGTIEVLNGLPEFHVALRTQSNVKQKQFRSVLKQLRTDEQLIRNVRNSLGGHVLLEDVQHALNEMSTDRFGYLEVGSILKKTHYRFASDLIAEMLLAGIPDAHRHAKAEAHFRTIARNLPVFALTDIIFSTYAEFRKLHE